MTEQVKQALCVHCRLPVQVYSATTYRYPLSNMLAHIACVSQPSAADMDALILEHKNARKESINA